jgi:hypothetical protein
LRPWRHRLSVRVLSNLLNHNASAFSAHPVRAGSERLNFIV